MNPNSPQPNFELPVPQPSDGELSSGSTEFSPQGPEVAKQKQPVIAHDDSQQQNVPMPQTQPVAPTNLTAPSSITPSIADDADLIEKEWVVKAKQIVSATKDDPHMQNKQMSKFKADYLKKRYHKDIKVEDV